MSVDRGSGRRAHKRTRTHARTHTHTQIHTHTHRLCAGFSRLFELLFASGRLLLGQTARHCAARTELFARSAANHRSDKDQACRGVHMHACHTCAHPCTPSLARSLPHSLVRSLARSPTHPHTHTLNHSLTHPPTKQSTNQLTNQPTNQPTNQSTHAGTPTPHVPHVCECI